MNILERTPTNFHLSNLFKPKRKGQVITIFFELICRQYHADIFRLGYSQIDFLIRYPIGNYRFIMEIPLSKKFDGIQLEAMYGTNRINVEMEKKLMDRIFKFSLSNLFPMEEIVTVTKDTNFKRE